MYSMNPLPVRVLPGTLSGNFPPPSAQRGDYDALVRLARRGPIRARAWREAASNAEPAAPHTAAGETCAEDRREASESCAPAAAHSIAQRERTLPHSRIARQPAAPRAPLAARSAVKPRVAIERRLEAFAAPCVEAIADSRQEFDGWTRFLVERAADFCCDRAVSAQGQWAVRLTLDPAILPDCTLHLTLSHFTLALRFEAQTNLSRQLVLHHEQTLRAQLAAVLEERGEPRDIEIAVD